MDEENWEQYDPAYSWDEAEQDFCEHNQNEDLLQIELVKQVEAIGETPAYEIYKATCKKCGWTETDILTIDYADYTVTIKNKDYTPITARGNLTKCVECGKVVFGVPLILWPSSEHPQWELDFCWNCVKKLGLLEDFK